ncbi:MAG: hypothetical protein COB50_01140 [Thiotrichales bacterium]|nr:MAG: hypothetical protein COB50_01140 [Thiotrichales bacterium]
MVKETITAQERSKSEKLARHTLIGITAVSVGMGIAAAALEYKSMASSVLHGTLSGYGAVLQGVATASLLFCALVGIYHICRDLHVLYTLGNKGAFKPENNNFQKLQAFYYAFQIITALTAAIASAASNGILIGCASYLLAVVNLFALVATAIALYHFTRLVFGKISDNKKGSLGLLVLFATLFTAFSLLPIAANGVLGSLALTTSSSIAAYQGIFVLQGLCAAVLTTVALIGVGLIFYNLSQFKKGNIKQSWKNNKGQLLTNCFFALGLATCVAAYLTSMTLNLPIFSITFAAYAILYGVNTKIDVHLRDEKGNILKDTDGSPETEKLTPLASGCRFALHLYKKTYVEDNAENIELGAT